MGCAKKYFFYNFGDGN